MGRCCWFCMFAFLLCGASKSQAHTLQQRDDGNGVGEYGVAYVVCWGWPSPSNIIDPPLRPVHICASVCMRFVCMQEWVTRTLVVLTECEWLMMFRPRESHTMLFCSVYWNLGVAPLTEQCEDDASRIVVLVAKESALFYSNSKLMVSVQRETHAIS